MNNENNTRNVTQVFCTRCGNQLSPEAKFCTNCGNSKNSTTTFQPRTIPYVQSRHHIKRKTKILEVISTTYYVFTGLSLFLVIIAVIAAFAGAGMAFQLFFAALTLATASFFQGILFSAIADIHKTIQK